NERRVQLRIHTAGPPDVAVTALRLSVAAGELRATGVVTNVGGLPAGPLHLTVAGFGMTRSQTMQTLLPTAARPVTFVLPIRPGDRGHENAFTLRAAAAPGEVDLANNEAGATVTPPVLAQPRHH